VQEDIDLKKSLEASRIKWTGNSFLGKYILVIVVSIWPVITLVPGIRDNDLLMFNQTYPYFLTCYFLLFIAYYYNSRSTKIEVNQAPILFRRIIEKKIINEGWRIYRSNQRYLVAEKPMGLVIGFKVGILYGKGFILINVQNEAGGRGYSPFSLGRNKRITNKFVKLIKEADKNILTP